MKLKQIEEKPNNKKRAENKIISLHFCDKVLFGDKKNQVAELMQIYGERNAPV